MKTYIADIIPKIQSFSKRLDDLTKLTNQHWVSLGDINQGKKVFIFRPNNQLLISDNGIVEKGSWDYLGNQSLLIETEQESYLLKHGFFDENVIALKLDSGEEYVFFVNETKYHSELNTIKDVLDFLKNKYLKNVVGGPSNPQGGSINGNYSYSITSENQHYNIVLGRHTRINLRFSNGKTGTIYKGHSSGKYFYYDGLIAMYCNNFEVTAYNLYVYLNK